MTRYDRLTSSPGERVVQACLRTSALAGHPAAPAVASTLAAALQAVDPYPAVRNVLHRAGDSLFIGEQRYQLDSIGRVRVVGIGKAAPAMGEATLEVLGDRVDGGVIVAKHATQQRIGGVEVLQGGHPLPTADSLLAARRLMACLQGVAAEDLVICLISGGGSALVAAPVAGVSLADLQEMTSSLLACGATIQEINTLRKHLDQLKGGGLARLIAPAHLVSLILSDVVGNPLDVIASGLTVPDPSTFADAWNVVQRYHLQARLPAGVCRVLREGLANQRDETPKPHDPLFERVDNLLIGSNRQAALAGLAHARQYGWNTLLLTTYLQGEARFAGQLLAALARQIASTGEPLPRPACLAVGGETTVTLRGNGRGGRNQEVALGALADLAGLENVILVTFGTDGEDGPTDAAGAVVTGESLARAHQANLDPAAALKNNDAYSFFDPLGDLLRSGPTGTNVNDLAFLFAL